MVFDSLDSARLWLLLGCRVSRPGPGHSTRRLFRSFHAERRAPAACSFTPGKLKTLCGASSEFPKVGGLHRLAEGSARVLWLKRKSPGTASLAGALLDAAFSGSPDDPALRSARAHRHLAWVCKPTQRQPAEPPARQHAAHLPSRTAGWRSSHGYLNKGAVTKLSPTRSRGCAGSGSP